MTKLATMQDVNIFCCYNSVNLYLFYNTRQLHVCQMLIKKYRTILSSLTQVPPYCIKKYFRYHFKGPLNLHHTMKIVTRALVKRLIMAHNKLCLWKHVKFIKANIKVKYMFNWHYAYYQPLAFRGYSPRKLLEL